MITELVTCAECGATCEPAGIGTGYATRPDGTRVCYQCADREQRAEFATANRFTAYVSTDSVRLTTWSGGLLARVMCKPGTSGISRAGWHGSRIYAWRFRAPDGSEWYGRNAGPGMAITVRRARRP